jgi:FtsP/CotA-like multicopper oxidase with cupredoxin domain
MNIRKTCNNIGCGLALLSLLGFSAAAQAGIPGLEMNVIDLYARQGQINTPDGDSLRIWGFSDTAEGIAQYPAPTIIIEEGQMVEVTIHNIDVPQGVSLVFPGQSDVDMSCNLGLATSNGCHAIPADNVVVADNGLHSITYRFVASRPGTFLYQSAENPQIQVEMGLAGALIVRPAMQATGVDADGGLV